MGTQHGCVRMCHQHKWMCSTRRQQGVVVLDINPCSPAAACLRAGDVILKLAGQEVSTRIPVLQELVHQCCNTDARHTIMSEAADADTLFAVLQVGEDGTLPFR